MTGAPVGAAAPPFYEAPQDHFGCHLDALHRVLSAGQRELDVWGELAGQDDAVVSRVLIDQAEDLRRRFADCAGQVARLLVQVRELEQAPAVVRIAASPVTLAVAAVASSLHAAAHAMSPVASGLCRDEHLAATVDASLRASRRFLRVAISALGDAAGLLGVGPGSTRSTGRRPATGDRPHA